jgi:pSer/pThr/pTyr-binding forkhead associated (FHA) protein
MANSEKAPKPAPATPPSAAPPPSEKKPEAVKPAEPPAPRKAPSPEELAAQFASAAQRGEWAVLPSVSVAKDKPAAALAPPPRPSALPASPAPERTVPTAEVVAKKPAAPAPPSTAPKGAKPSTIVDEPIPGEAVPPPPLMPFAATVLTEPSAKDPSRAGLPSIGSPGTVMMDREERPKPASVAQPKPAAPAEPPERSLPETQTMPTPPPAVAPVLTGTALPMEKPMSNVPPDKGPGPTPPRAAPVPDIRQTMVFGRLPIQARVDQQKHYLDALDASGQWATLVEIGPQGVVVGRTQGNVTLPVASLGTSHARFSYDEGQTIVADLGARNGVMLKIQQPLRLKFGQRFRVGSHLLELRRFERVAPAATTDGPDRDEELCTREITPHAELVFIGPDGHPAFAMPLLKPETVLGRDLAADVPLIGDPASSRRHASIRFDNGQHMLEDLGSANGTFTQITGQERLRPGDIVALGVLLFRVADKETKKAAN